jgi:short-subunit dehydrogenase
MVVLITGASGGLGKVLGELLTSKGLTVYGTMRNTQGKEKDYSFPLISMEATDDNSVQQCIDQIVEKEGSIDVVVNCVNQMFIGSVEEASVAEVEDLYRTNVFGALRICKAVLPAMRKQANGCIINMSSLGGLLAVPYMSAYTSAKFALETISEALYREIKDDNISVTIMQPVAMKMDRAASGSHLRLVDKVKKGSFSHKMLAGMAKDTVASKLTPEMVAGKIYQVIQAKKKPLRVPMDKAKAVTILKRVAPLWLIDTLIKRLQADMAK